MGQRTQAAVGCLTALAGLGAGCVVWSEVVAEGRIHRFETGPDWRVFYLGLPVCLGGGIVLGTLAGVLLHRLVRTRPFTARRSGPPDRG
ncbi:hypothetical protein GTY65_32250 [Streptomyces sp. SID8379]|uniref:hypothetical protein n=1 Tax=unclassified Streptomyces TaxID=2593676 RepID=UPI00039BBF73|nr:MULTISPECIES: hypothetical protein [unclassified Streptomyces]MYW68716.1 hypothetical protein [Streptomyces sp. SID8379]